MKPVGAVDMLDAPVTRSSAGSSGKTKGEKGRDRIVREATKLFAKYGYHGTGIDALCKAAKIKKGGLYYHIESKQKLLFDILIEATRWPLERAKMIVESSDPPEAKFRNLCRLHMLTIGENLHEYRILTHDLDCLDLKHRRRIMANRDHYEDQWRSVLEEGVETGVFRNVHPITLKGILGQFNFSYTWWRSGGELTLEEAADIFCDALLRGLENSK